MAIGRKPNVQGLCGPDVSLEMKNGKIAVSPGFETSEPGVYAIGDVCADIQLAHVAAAQGTYAVSYTHLDVYKRQGYRRCSYALSGYMDVFCLF